MRRTLVIVIALLLAITLLPACKGGGGGGGVGNETGGGGGTPPGGNETPPGGTTAAYTGFMAATAGQWVDYVMAADGEELHQIMENIGEDTVDGASCVGFEITMVGEDTIVQMWTDTATGQLVKYVMKMGDQVMCMDIGQAPYEPPETETPGEYAPDLAESYGTYEVPATGETVDVAIFTSEGVETWISSEVPFGLVQVIVSGTATMSLNNFGTSGAARDISKAEMEDCMPIPGF